MNRTVSFNKKRGGRFKKRLTKNDKKRAVKTACFNKFYFFTLSKSSEDKKLTPEIVKNEPGSCPKCGMNLVPVDVKEKENFWYLLENLVKKGLKPD